MDDERRQIGLPLALGFSAFLHLLLLLITLWSPFSMGTEAAPPLDESVMRFTFAQPTEEELDGQVEGDVPFEQPESTQAPPVPPQREPDLQPEGRPSLQPPSSAAPPPPLEQLEQIEEQLERERSDQEPPRPEESTFDEPENPTLSDDPNAELSGTSDLARPAPSRDRQPWNVNQALKEWGQALEEYRASQPTTPGGGQPRNVFTPEPGTFPTTGYGMGNLLFESKDFDWSDYARQIYIAIWRAWHQRLYETTEDFAKWAQHDNNGLWWIDHRVQIVFVIQNDGDVTGIGIESDSGCLPLDESAVDALAEVSLPPLPSEFPRDSETVHARFIAVGDIGNMRQVLAYYKRMGYF